MFLESTVETKPQLNTTDLTCPLCQAWLSQLSSEDAEFHVNSCLDNVILQDKKAQRSAKRLASIKPQPAKTKKKKTTGEFKPTVSVTKEPKPFITDTIHLSIEDMLQEIELVPLVPESSKLGNYTYVYSNPPHSPGTFDRENPQLPIPKPRIPRSLPKPVPGYKWMPETSFTVDAFKYGLLDSCTAYFLTHFHADHYGGLTKSFAGHIYCSRITANCVLEKYNLNPKQVHALPMNTRCIVQGVYVTLIDAEHCPGAAIILFEVPVKNAKNKIIRIVHTGDFRASDVHVRRILRVFGTDIAKPVTPDMLLSKDTDLKIELPRIDYIYLDTTYLEPTYAFPKQTQVTEVVSRACYQISRSSTFLPTHLNSIKNAKRASSSGHASSSPDKKKTSLITSWFKPLQKALLAGPNSSGNMDPGSNSNNIRSNVLFVVGTYTIGKERLFIDIARRINSKIYVTKEKRKLLECIASSSVLGMLTDKMAEAQVHAVSMGIVNMSGMAEYLESVQGKSKFTSIVAFSPTGWSHAGPYIPGRKEAPPTIFPELPSAADLATVTKSNDRASVASVLAKSARISSDHQSAFSLDKLRPRGSSNKVTIFPVPYSEHSSFAELARFICSLRATNVIPTVYSSAAKNEYARDWLDHWQRLNELFDSTIKQNAQADGKKESSPLGFALELG